MSKRHKSAGWGKEGQNITAPEGIHKNRGGIMSGMRGGLMGGCRRSKPGRRHGGR